MNDDIDQADAQHQRRMERASDGLRRAIAAARAGLPLPGGPGPALIWREVAPGGMWAPQPGSQDDLRKDRTLARLEARDRRAEQQRTHRDPCRLCGVRADIGCRHARVA